METGRGKKSKKTGWHLTLGIKETIFVGVGVAGLMMMSFALGALAGRGDIYRAASSWGLMSPEGPKMAQWTPGGVTAGPPAVASVPTPAPAAAPAVQAPATVPVAVKPEKPGSVVTGSVVPLSPPVPAATAKKKTKTGTIHKDPKAREEEMRRMRQEVVQKLKFQNSFDKDFKARLPKSKDHEKAQAKSGGTQAQPTQGRVAQYRNSKEAKAKVAELQKKGIKATVRKAKDSKGTLYVVCKPEAAHHADTEKLAKKPEKSSGGVKKLRIEQQLSHADPDGPGLGQGEAGPRERG